MTLPTIRWRSLALGALGIVVLAGLWELYKLLGPEGGVQIGGTTVLPRTTDRAMPHVWDMVAVFGRPTTGGVGAETIFATVTSASLFSLRIAALGWLIGVVVGFVLAVAMSRFGVVESALLPWVILSQTVPLIAIAPLVRRWGAGLEIGSFQWQTEHSVAVIAAYLAFFPVAVGALRGLKSLEATHVDLMTTYGVSWWTTFRRLRLPASVPYLIPALRLGAASAVIGTVVAEVSIGLRGGIGRLIIEFAQSAGSDPAKAWAPIFGAVAVGLIAAAAVALIGVTLRRYRRQEIVS